MATSSVQDFKARRYDTIELPSGLQVQARRSGMEAFIKAGRIPNSLMPVIKASMKGSEEAKKALEEMDVEPEMLTEMFGLFDTVCANVICVPKVWPTPEGDEERVEDRLYVDEIEDADKQFIFQWAVGGTSSVEKFRQDTQDALGALRQSAEVPQPSEQPVGDS